MQRRGTQVVRVVLVLALGAVTLLVAASPAAAAVPPTVSLVPVESGVEAGQVANFTVHVQNGDGDNPITVSSIFSYGLVCGAPTTTVIAAAPAEADVGTCTHRTRASDTEVSPYQASAIVTFEVGDAVESAPAFLPVTFPDHDFADVTGDELYADGLAWAKFYELVSGFGDNTFRGGSPVKRGQIVSILWHLVDEPVVNTPHGFRDVPANAFYREALNWAKARGLVTGFAGNRYRPAQSVTRGQLVNMVYKMVGSPPLGSGPGYTDVSGTFRNAARWVRQNDLLEDVAPGPKLFPARAATRGEVVYFLREVAREQFAWARWNQDGPSTWLFDDDNVSITNRRYVLNRVTVDVGETVFWGNNDQEAHTVTSNTDAWDELPLGTNGSGDVTFDEAGTFLYHCELHPNMTGRVTVQA
jgi:plastocyanin